MSMDDRELSELVEFLTPEAISHYRRAVSAGYARPAVFAIVGETSNSLDDLQSVQMIPVDLAVLIKRGTPESAAEMESDLNEIPRDFFPLLFIFESGQKTIAGIMIPDLN